MPGKFKTAQGAALSVRHKRYCPINIKPDDKNRITVNFMRSGRLRGSFLLNRFAV